MLHATGQDYPLRVLVPGSRHRYLGDREGTLEDQRGQLDAPMLQSLIGSSAVTSQIQFGITRRLQLVRRVVNGFPGIELGRRLGFKLGLGLGLVEVGTRSYVACFFHLFSH